MHEIISLGKWSPRKLDELLRQAGQTENPGGRILFLSGQFMDTPYKESTLIGDSKRSEELVINFETFDCFTFLDTVESMRLSHSFIDFRKNLIRIRYKEGFIGYKKRNHFFSDWREANKDSIQEMTGQIGGAKIKTVDKILNLKDDGSFFLAGIEPIKRTVSYIPSENIDKSVLTDMKTGDYVGIYSEIQGLDVSHVGIFIHDRSGPTFRHASSAPSIKKVVDQDFFTYISSKPGIIILRPY